MKFAVVPQSTLLICGIGAGPRTNKLEPYPGSKNLMPTAFDRTIDFVAINVYFSIFFLTCFNNSSTINGWFAYAAALRGNSLHLSSLYLNTGRRKYGLVTLAEYSGEV